MSVKVHHRVGSSISIYLLLPCILVICILSKSSMCTYIYVSCLPICIVRSSGLLHLLSFVFVALLAMSRSSISIYLRLLSYFSLSRVIEDLPLNFERLVLSRLSELCLDIENRESSYLIFSCIPFLALFV